MHKALKKILLSLETTALAQTSLFDRIWEGRRPVVLYGAGATGRDLAACMRSEHAGRLFFSDQRQNLWNTVIDGIPVLSPAEATRKMGEGGIFVITIFNRERQCAYAAIARELGRLGASRCIPWAFPAWKYANTLLPRFFLGSAKDILPFRDEIRMVFEELADARSCTTFLELLEASLTAPFDKLSAWEQGPQYFIPEVLQRLPDRATMVDCGAYDGDTLRDALNCLGKERIEAYHAFEPDRENFTRLQAFVSELPADLRPRITCTQAAVGEKAGFVSLAAPGTEGSFVASDANGEIPCVALDSLLGSRRCDFIKMDIEGYEKNALRGARNTLEHGGILAVAAYHKPDDFFSIPLCIKNIRDGFGIFRTHYANLFETVFYHFMRGDNEYASRN